MQTFPELDGYMLNEKVAHVIIDGHDYSCWYVIDAMDSLWTGTYNEIDATLLATFEEYNILRNRHPTELFMPFYETVEQLYDKLVWNEED